MPNGDVLHSRQWQPAADRWIAQFRIGSGEDPYIIYIIVSGSPGQQFDVVYLARFVELSIRNSLRPA